jgi:hypothetical protein
MSDAKTELRYRYFMQVWEEFSTGTVPPNVEDTASLTLSLSRHEKEDLQFRLTYKPSTLIFYSPILDREVYDWNAIEAFERLTGRSISDHLGMTLL